MSNTRMFFVDFNLTPTDKSVYTTYVKASDKSKALTVIKETYKDSINHKIYEVNEEPVDKGWYLESGEFVPPRN